MANLIYNKQFSDGNFNGTQVVQQCRASGDFLIANSLPYSYSVAFSAENPRHSPVSARLEIRGEEPTDDVPQCDEGERKHRLEVLYTSSSDSGAPSGEEQWYGLSYYIDSSWPTGTMDPPYTYVAQIIQHGGKPAEVGLKLGHNSNLQMQIVRASNIGGEATIFTISTPTGWRRGFWNDVVIRHVRSTTSNGSIQVWRRIVGIDSAYQPILTYNGISAYYGPQVGQNNSDYDYKAGLYWGNQIDPNKDCIIKLSGLRVARGSDGFDLVDPSLGAGVALVPPSFSPPGSNFYPSVLVSLSSPQSPDEIYYTLDGSTPTTASIPYSVSGPFVLFTSTTPKAFAVKSGWTDSPVSEAAFTLSPPTPPAPPGGIIFMD